MKAIGYTVTTIGFLIYAPLINGWALTKLWTWFIVSRFGLPTLSISQAIGIALIVGFLTKQDDDCTKEKKVETFGEVLLIQFGRITAKALIAALIGWIVKQFLPA